MTANSDAKQRRQQALQLHLAVATFQAIADTLGYANRGTAHKVVHEALDELAPDIKPHQATKIARIDAMLQGLWPKARKGDVQAIDRVIKLEQWREQLVGEGTQSEEQPRGNSKLATLRAIHGGKSGPAAAG
jgi:hypothetical protein